MALPTLGIAEVCFARLGGNAQGYAASKTITAIPSAIPGFPGLEESRGYIQHWLRQAEITNKTAQRIFATANKILKAGQQLGITNHD